MKFLIIRTHPTKINIKTYNVQEIGLAKAFIARGHECDILLYTDGESSVESLLVGNDKKIKIYWEHGRNIFWQGVYNWQKIFSLASEYDWIQVNEYNQIASYYITKRYPRNSYIYHGPYYNSDNKKYNLLNKLFDILFLKKMQKEEVIIFAKSELAKESLKRKGFSKVITIGVGLDIERFGEKNISANSKEDGKCNLLYIGEISARRNTLFLIEVFYSVYKEMNGKVNLQIIGRGSEDYTKRVKERVRALKIENAINFIERKNQNELPEVYIKSDLFIFPTKYDIFGMVLLEALYFGVPVISSQNGGSETLLKDSHCGIILNQFDAEKWASIIVDVLKNTQLRNQMSKAGQKKIIYSFTWKAIAEKIISNLIIEKE